MIHAIVYIFIHGLIKIRVMMLLKYWKLHLIRMKISDADRVLAMGPYLAAGTMIAALWGQDMIAWYLGAMM